jgi:hypothetical protein
VCCLLWFIGLIGYIGFIELIGFIGVVEFIESHTLSPSPLAFGLLPFAYLFCPLPFALSLSLTPYTLHPAPSIIYLPAVEFIETHVVEDDQFHDRPPL